MPPLTERATECTTPPQDVPSHCWMCQPPGVVHGGRGLFPNLCFFHISRIRRLTDVGVMARWYYRHLGTRHSTAQAHASLTQTVTLHLTSLPVHISLWGATHRDSLRPQEHPANTRHKVFWWTPWLWLAFTSSPLTQKTIFFDSLSWPGGGVMLTSAFLFASQFWRQSRRTLRKTTTLTGGQIPLDFQQTAWIWR